MDFRSILFKKPDDPKREALHNEPPSFFIDLNLHLIVERITSKKEEYDLKPFFYTSLCDSDTIKYRQSIMQDIEETALFKHLKSFSQKMHTVREQISQANKLSYHYQKERIFLDAAEIYGAAVSTLANDLSQIELKSDGFLAFRDYLENYIQSLSFTSLRSETKKLIDDLSSIKYVILIKDNFVTVDYCETDVDYSAEVEQTFERFKRGAVKDYRIKIPFTTEMNHIETQILDRVAILFPDTFRNLDAYYEKNNHFMDETIVTFDREIQFYIAYLEYIAELKQAGLKFCYPILSQGKKEIYNYEGFDLALAHKLIHEESSIICNDFYLKDKERILVVSGPNQGGKTTFARTFGQLHFLANLGLPVPGRESQLYLFDNLFTHFEKEEKIETLRGRLEDDLIRIHEIINQATPHSIIIMNEIFTSTTLQDAIFLSKEMMEKIIAMDAFCVWITFIDELASLSEKTVSMVSTVVPETEIRTFKIVRKPPEGLAYALSIAGKYQLSYDLLKGRIKS